MTDEKYIKICNIVNYIAIGIAVVLAIISWFVLPDRVASSFGSNAGEETLSRIEAIGIPCLIMAVGSFIYFYKKDFRAILVSALGIAGFIINFICN